MRNLAARSAPFQSSSRLARLPSCRSRGGPNPSKDNAVRVAKRKATKKERSANQNKKHRELQLELAKQLGLKGPVTFNSVAAHFAALAHLGSDRAAVRGGMSDAFRADVQFVEEWVKHELRQMDGSHDWWHIHRVRNTALAIARKERPDGDDPAFDLVVELAALVHDVRDWKYSGDPEAGTRAIARDVAGMIRTITDVHPDVLRRVLNVVQRVGFKDELATSGEARGGGDGSKRNQPKKKSVDDLPLELKVVQDADRLDAIGAIGIARTFCYGGAKGHAMHVPGVNPRERLTRDEYVGGKDACEENGAASARVETTVNHFHEKLLRLRGLMKTETGRAMAEKRHDRMVAFLEHFHEEWEGA